MSKFQDYLKNTGLTFEEYREWFRSLRVGDSVFRNNLGKRHVIAEVSEVLEGIRFEYFLLFFCLYPFGETMFVEHPKEPIKLANPENFPIPDKEELSEIKRKRDQMTEEEIRLLKKYRDELTAEHKSQIEGVRQSLKATKEQYEANLKAKDEAFSTLQLQASDIENHRDSLLKDLEQARINFETCEEHRHFLLEKVDEELQKVAFLNQQVQRMVAEKNELQNKLNSSLEQAKSLVGATQEVSKLKDRVADLMEKNEELKGSLQILETKRVQLQCQLEREESVSTKWHQEAVACRQKLEKLSALANLHA